MKLATDTVTATAMATKMRCSMNLSMGRFLWSVTGRDVRRPDDCSALPRAIRGLLPPPSAGEGGPRVSEGRERGARYPEASLPSPDPLRGPPSPAKGRGDGAGCIRDE